MGLILLIILILLLVGAAPAWPYSRQWGYGPSGLVGLLLVVVLSPQAARKAGSEVKAAPVTAVRLTNSRRLIRCIPFSSYEVVKAHPLLCRTSL